MLNSCQAGVDAAKLSDEKKISVMKDVNAMVLELEGLLNRTNSTERFVRRLLENFLQNCFPSFIPKASEVLNSY